MKLVCGITIAGGGRKRFTCSVIRTVLIGVCLATGSESIIQAAEWSVLPSISMKGYYNSNLLLTPFPHEATYGYWISPGTEFSARSERFEISGRAALDFVDYYGDQQNRFTNVNLPLRVRYRTERDEFGFTGGFVRDNTLMGELLNTGVVLQFTQRNLWTANPTWTRDLSEKLAFQGGFKFSDASYQDGIRLGLVDYQMRGASAGFLYHATEKDDIQLTGTYDDFNTRNAPFALQATFPGAVLSVTHSFTETLQGTVYGGPRFVNSTTDAASGSVESASTVWVYGVSLMKQFEQGSVQVNLTRDVFPSGFGLLIQTDRAGFRATYDMSETVSLSLDTSGYIASGVTSLASGGGTIPDQKLFYAAPMITWKFMEWWKAEFSYGYRLRDVESFPDSATANMMTLMLTYYPPKLAISR